MPTTTRRKSASRTSGSTSGTAERGKSVEVDRSGILRASTSRQCGSAAVGHCSPYWSRSHPRTASTTLRAASTRSHSPALSASSTRHTASSAAGAQSALARKKGGDESAVPRLRAAPPREPFGACLDGRGAAPAGGAGTSEVSAAAPCAAHASSHACIAAPALLTAARSSSADRGDRIVCLA